MPACHRYLLIFPSLLCPSGNKTRNGSVIEPNCVHLLQNAKEPWYGSCHWFLCWAKKSDYFKVYGADLRYVTAAAKQLRLKQLPGKYKQHFPILLTAVGQHVDSSCNRYFKSTLPAMWSASDLDQLVGFYRLRVNSDVCSYLANTWTSNADPGLQSKPVFSQGGRRSEVRCGSVSQLPPWFPVPEASYQRREKERGGRRTFKRRARQHRRSKASKGFMCASKVLPAFISMRSCFASGLKGLGPKFRDIDSSKTVHLHQASCIPACYILFINPNFLRGVPVIVLVIENSSLFLPDHQTVLYQLTGWTEKMKALSPCSPSLIKTQPHSETWWRRQASGPLEFLQKNEREPVVPSWILNIM